MVRSLLTTETKHVSLTVWNLFVIPPNQFMVLFVLHQGFGEGHTINHITISIVILCSQTISQTCFHAVFERLFRLNLHVFTFCRTIIVLVCWMPIAKNKEIMMMGGKEGETYLLIAIMCLSKITCIWKLHACIRLCLRAHLVSSTIQYQPNT